MAWSNVDIKKNLNRRIIIHPYQEDSCTGYSYDISINYIRSLSKESTCKIDGSNVIIPGDTAFCIISKEYFKLDETVFANIYARFSSTSKGIKINATAIEPGYSKNILIYGKNTTKDECILDLKSIATIVFHSLERPATKLSSSEASSSFWEKHVSDINAKVEILKQLEKMGAERNVADIEFEFINNKRFYYRSMTFIKELPNKLGVGYFTKTLASLAFLTLFLSNIQDAIVFIKNLF